MHQSELEDGNRKISKFMQQEDTYSLVDIDKQRGDFVLVEGCDYETCKEDISHFSDRYGVNGVIVKDIPTYNTWNDLMPVVEKIGKIASVRINPSMFYTDDKYYVEVDYRDSTIDPVFVEGIDLLKVCYEAVVEFITKYNER